ncbi:MAG: GGDEF domain-containing protein [Desulfobacteraceae bacterium]|nr:GGDEF domain-containing protein [Desulfobacteraceae bacterium]
MSFDRTFDRKWRSAVRHTWPISLIFFDMDFFKRYNDNYGHQAGDDCLERIGHVIMESLQRSDDFAARYGGEEFIILLSHTGMDKALETAEKIRRPSPAHNCLLTLLPIDKTIGNAWPACPFFQRPLRMHF